MAAKIYAQASFGLVQLFGSVLTGKVTDVVKDMRAHGAKVSFIALELDPIFPIKDQKIREYAKKLAGTDDIRAAVVALILASGHGAYVMNPVVLAEALRRHYLEHEANSTSS